MLNARENVSGNPQAREKKGQNRQQSNTFRRNDSATKKHKAQMKSVSLPFCAKTFSRAKAQRRKKDSLKTRSALRLCAFAGEFFSTTTGAPRRGRPYEFMEGIILCTT